MTSQKPLEPLKFSFNTLEEDKPIHKAMKRFKREVIRVGIELEKEFRNKNLADITQTNDLIQEKEKFIKFAKKRIKSIHLTNEEKSLLLENKNLSEYFLDGFYFSDRSKIDISVEIDPKTHEIKDVIFDRPLLPEVPTGIDQMLGPIEDFIPLPEK